jgi:hypothetical protein
MATRYELGGPGFDSQEGQHFLIFSTVSRPAMGPTQPPTQCVWGALALGVKRPGRECDLNFDIMSTVFQVIVVPFSYIDSKWQVSPQECFAVSLELSLLLHLRLVSGEICPCLFVMKMECAIGISLVPKVDIPVFKGQRSRSDR